MLLNRIAQTIFDKKGMNILALDLRNVSNMTDYFLIAEGSVDRHVIGIYRAIIEDLQKEGRTPLHTEGEQVGDWVVIDYGDIIIHLFTPEMREKYALEQLWHEGKIADLSIKTHQNEKVNS